MKTSHLIFALLCFIILFFMGYGVSIASPKIITILIVGFIFSVLTIMKLETGLFLLIFVIPFTQQLTFATLCKTSPQVVEVGTDDIFIIFIMLSWLAGLARRKEPIFLKTPLNWPIAAFFVATLLSFMVTYAKLGGSSVLVGFLHLCKFFEYVLIYFIVVSVIDNFEQIKKFLLMFFIVVGFIAIIHVSALIIWQGYSIATATLAHPGSHTYNKFYLHIMHAFNCNATLGVYYAFFLSILIAIILDTPVSKGKVPLILLAILLSFCLFNSFSRSAYVALFVSFLILSILKEKRFILIVLLLLIFSPIFLQSAILKRITLTIESVQPLIFDASSQVRIFLWKKSFGLFLKNPIFGIGYWASRQLLRTTPHNQYLTNLLETGIVGFSAFCWLIIRMFKGSIILMKKANTVFLKALGAGYIAGLAAILVTCFFSEPFQSFRMVGPLWFVTALIASANRLLSEKSEKLGIDST